MPGCVFHVRGSQFDPAPFLATASLKPYSVGRKGDQKYGKVKKFGGFSCDASTREDFGGEVEDAIAFLKANYHDLLRLGLIPEVESKTLDFGHGLRITDGQFFCQSDYLPPELLRLAGELGVGIELSMYAPHPGTFEVVWPPSRETDARD